MTFVWTFTDVVCFVYQNKNLTKYAKVNTKGTSRGIRQTQKQVTKLRINNEIKYLYAKKQNINK
jgi:hypothetical protein